ncbi:MAG: hypothetical protein KGL19_05440, partial [Bacteroidota bacterium]|nr:hypothetical protein [Bacteroidota bacterium]
PKRIVLMAAILEKYLHIKLSDHDIFFKVSGNLKIKESGSDLGIALALLSSYFQQALPAKSVALGEVNLTGQIKSINQVNMHISEAQNFGVGKISKDQLEDYAKRKEMSYDEIEKWLRQNVE